MPNEYFTEFKRLLLIVAASIIMAVNIKTFVEAGGLVPGGFNGLTVLLQRIGITYFNISLPFTAINFTLNAIPAVISYRFIGKQFTLYSCLMIFLTGVLTDIIPSSPLTYDVLLIAIFGGVINGFAVSLCLMGEATSGGTDFIAIFLSERLRIDCWNYIFFANVVMLGIAGWLFGWEKAMYSMLFQYASTQVVQMMHLRYKKHTLFIITNHAPEIYKCILECTHHGATMFEGTGCYLHEGDRKSVV